LSFVEIIELILEMAYILMESDKEVEEELNTSRKVSTVHDIIQRRMSRYPSASDYDRRSEYEKKYSMPNDVFSSVHEVD
jgi:hypothetical protein